MHLYVVGEPYVTTRTKWEERADYNYRGGEHELRLFVATPTEHEIDSVDKAPIDLGLYIESSAIFLLYAIGDALSGEASYSWWLVGPEERQLPNPEPGDEERALLHILLVDADTGILKAMRAVSFSPSFTRALHAAIRKQARARFDPREHDKDIARAYRRHPATGDMFGAAVARCRGGD